MNLTQSFFIKLVSVVLFIIGAENQLEAMQMSSRFMPRGSLANKSAQPLEESIGSLADMFINKSYRAGTITTKISLCQRCKEYTEQKLNINDLLNMVFAKIKETPLEPHISTFCRYIVCKGDSKLFIDLLEKGMNYREDTDTGSGSSILAFITQHQKDNAEIKKTFLTFKEKEFKSTLITKLTSEEIDLIEGTVDGIDVKNIKNWVKDYQLFLNRQDIKEILDTLSILPSTESEPSFSFRRTSSVSREEEIKNPLHYVIALKNQQIKGHLFNFFLLEKCTYTTPKLQSLINRDQLLSELVTRIEEGSSLSATTKLQDTPNTKDLKSKKIERNVLKAAIAIRSFEKENKSPLGDEQTPIVDLDQKLEITNLEIQTIKSKKEVKTQQEKVKKEQEALEKEKEEEAKKVAERQKATLEKEEHLAQQEKELQEKQQRAAAQAKMVEDLKQQEILTKKAKEAEEEAKKAAEHEKKIAEEKAQAERELLALQQRAKELEVKEKNAEEEMKRKTLEAQELLEKQQEAATKLTKEKEALNLKPKKQPSESIAQLQQKDLLSSNPQESIQTKDSGKTPELKDTTADKKNTPIISILETEEVPQNLLKTAPTLASLIEVAITSEQQPIPLEKVQILEESGEKSGENSTTPRQEILVQKPVQEQEPTNQQETTLSTDVEESVSSVSPVTIEAKQESFLSANLTKIVTVGLISGLGVLLYKHMQSTLEKNEQKSDQEQEPSLDVIENPIEITASAA